MDIYQQKKALRKQIKEVKNSYSLDQKKALSREILDQIEVLPQFVESHCIMAYWSMNDEVFTHDFVQKWSPKKTMILPVVKGDQLELSEYRGVDELVAGDKFGIPEPKGKPFENKEQIELVIVPGVAFDKHFNRMGRGKAYYDQLLTDLKAFKLGVCFHFQLLEEVPYDELDVKMDLVLSNKKMSP